jgi:hypothetical protein
MFERKSVKNKKINVKYIKVDSLHCLKFTLNEPFYEIIIGASNFNNLIETQELIVKVNSIFKNVTKENVFCLDEEVKREILKFNKFYFVGEK